MKKCMQKAGILILSLMMVFCQFTIVGAEQVKETVVFEEYFNDDTLSSIWSVNSNIGGMELDNGTLKLTGISEKGGSLSAKDGRWAVPVFRMEAGKAYRISYRIKGVVDEGTAYPPFRLGLIGNRERGWLCVDKPENIATNYVVEWYDSGIYGKPKMTGEWQTVSYQITLNGSVKGRKVTADDPEGIYTVWEHTPVLETPLEEFPNEELRITMTGAANEVYLDDIKIVQLNTYYTITGDVGAGGTVTYNDAPFANGTEAEVMEGARPSFTITPDSGYEVESVRFGTEDYSSAIVDKAAGGAVTLPAVAEDATLTVRFVSTEPPSDPEPGFTTGASYLLTEQNYVYEGADGERYEGFSIVLFTALNRFAYTPGAQCGVEFFDPQSGTREQLPAVFIPLAGGRYGIRVFGPALRADASYELRPYVKVEDDIYYGETVYLNR